MKNKTSEILSILSCIFFPICFISFFACIVYQNKITEIVSMFFSFLYCLIRTVAIIYNEIKFKAQSRYLFVMPFLTIGSFVMLILLITGKYQYP